MDKPTTVDRRKFLGALGVTVGGTGLAGAGLVAGPQLVKAAAQSPKGKIPDTPYKTGHICWRPRRSTPKAGCWASGRSRPSLPTKAPALTRM